MIYPFQIGLVESTGRADPGLLFQINSFRLNSGNNKKHGLCLLQTKCNHEIML